MRMLITSVGAKVPLLRWARIAIDKAGGGAIVGQDRDLTVTGARFVDEMSADIPSDCDVVIPTRDAELAWIAKYGAVVCEDIDRFTDKLRFSEYCKVLGIKHPVTTLSPEGHDLPMVSKARNGSGSRDFRILLTKQFTIAKDEPEQIYQERITGTEYSCDAYYTCEGQLHGYVVRSRDRINHGEAWVTTVTTDRHLSQVCRDYLQRFDGMRGPVNMQLIGDTLIEINPRVGGAISCSIAAGLDVLYWSILEAQGKTLPRFELYPVRQIRFATDIYEEIA